MRSFSHPFGSRFCTCFFFTLRASVFLKCKFYVSYFASGAPHHIYNLSYPPSAAVSLLSAAEDDELPNLKMNFSEGFLTPVC
jgi:hypothetical protein